MAIEIESESQRGKSNVVNYFLYIGLALLLIIGGVYGFLYLSTNKAEKKVASFEKQLDQQMTEKDKTLEDRITNAQKKINRAGKVIKKHKASSNFFEFLEKNTHPKVRFNRTDLSVASGRVKLSGVTESFSELGQQVNLLQSKKMIKSVDVSGARLISGGKVGFDIVIILNPEIFNFPQYSQ